MSIYRIGYGVIFDDNFETLDTRWLVSPSNSYSYSSENQRLTLKHNSMSDRSVNALFELPQDEEHLLLQVHADYVPTHLGDEGGIVVWKNALEKVEFLESEDTSQAGEYSIWRAVKRGNLWSFFAEKNNAWELFDSTLCMSPTMAGIVLKGEPREGYKDLNIDRVILCKGSAITIGNVNSGYRVELVDGDTGEVVDEQVVPDGFAGIDIELPTIPFNGIINIYDKNKLGEYYLADKMEEPVMMYGGDLFLKGTELSVLWKGKELLENKPTHLGSMKNNEIEYKMTLWNKSTGNVAENTTIRIAMYLEEWGWEWADLALDGGNKPLEYSDSIFLDRLQAGEQKDFWLKITKVVDEVWDRRMMKPTYFVLEVTNE